MSAFGDAVLAQMTAGLDPQAQMIRDYGASMIRANEASVIEIQERTVSSLSSALIKAKADDAPTSVIDAYDRLLARATSLV